VRDRLGRAAGIGVRGDRGTALGHRVVRETVVGGVEASGRWLRHRAGVLDAARPAAVQVLPTGVLPTGSGPAGGGGGGASGRELDRLAGASALAFAAGLVVSPLVGLALATALPARGVLRRRSAARRARGALLVEVPDVVDLFRVAARAGATPVSACRAVARHADGVIGAACGRTLDAMAAGLPFVVALDRMRALGDGVLPLVDALAAAERDGAPLLVALDRVAGDGRLERRRAAEESARAVPVRLLFPLVLCTLPAFGLLTVVPLLVRSLTGLLP
jgi:hypothetical protein